MIELVEDKLDIDTYLELRQSVYIKVRDRLRR